MSFLYFDMTQVVEIFPEMSQGPTHSTREYIVNIMAADILAMQGARAISSYDIDLL